MFYFRGICYERSKQWPNAEADLKKALRAVSRPAAGAQLSRLFLGRPGRQSRRRHEHDPPRRRAAAGRRLHRQLARLGLFPHRQLRRGGEGPRARRRAQARRLDHQRSSRRRLLAGRPRRWKRTSSGRTPRTSIPSRKTCRRSRPSSKSGCPTTRPPRPTPAKHEEGRQRRVRLVLPVPLVENAPAKVNLTLRVLRRRDDGYHEIESLVVFADFGDRLSFSRGGELTLTVRRAERGSRRRGRRQSRAQGRPRARGAAPGRHARRVPARQAAAGRGRTRRRFGRCGGGAAALGAEPTGLAPDDPDALRGGPRDRRRRAGLPRSAPADHARHRRGAFGAAIALPPLPAVLVNPGVALPTKAVFAAMEADVRIRALRSTSAAVARLSERARSCCSF